MPYSKLTPGTDLRPHDEAQISQRITEFRQGDFSYIEQTVVPRYFRRSAAKRIARDVPLIASYARELAPHYDHRPRRTFFGEIGAVRRVEELATQTGLDSIMREVAHRLVSQHTVLGVWLPVGAGQWSVLPLDPWEYEIDPHPQAPRSLRMAREIRLRLPRKAFHLEVQYDIATFRRAAPGVRETATWRDGTPIYSDARTLPLGEYPCFYARLGDPSTGDFNGPLPRWLYSAQIASSLTLMDMEFQARYSGAQLIGYGLAQEIANKMDWGSDGIAATQHTKSEIEIASVDRPFRPDGHVASSREFDASLRLSMGMRPRSFESHAVTAEAKLVELWDRQQARQDVTLALQAAEGSWLRSARIIGGWDFGAGSDLLSPMRVDVEYQMPMPPQNAYQRAQGWRLMYEDGTLSPADVLVQLAAERGQMLTREQAVKALDQNIAEYNRIVAARAAREAAPLAGAFADGA